jgi:hypothetical protein
VYISPVELRIASTWNGEPASREEEVSVRMWLEGMDLRVEVEACYWGDPWPTRPPGRVDRLWEHEVVELFLLGDDQRYIEIEMGPHGHYLVLRLEGRRQVEARALLMEYQARIVRGRWSASAHLPQSVLPANVRRGNAYAMHGVGVERRYLAAFPVPGSAPDFHRLDCFGIVELG